MTLEEKLQALLLELREYEKASAKEFKAPTNPLTETYYVGKFFVYCTTANRLEEILRENSGMTNEC